VIQELHEEPHPVVLLQLLVAWSGASTDVANVRYQLRVELACERPADPAPDSGAVFSVGPIGAVPEPAVTGRFASDRILDGVRQAKASNDVLTATQKTFARALPAIGMVSVLSLLLFVEIPGHGLWHRALLDFAHAPIFAAVAVLLLIMREPAARTRRSAYVIAFAAALVLGIAIEFVQSLGGRPGSVFDVMTDAAGAAAGLALWSLFQRPRADHAWPALAIALAGITFVAWPPLQTARAYAHRAVAFPTIVDFRDPGSLQFVTTEGSPAWIADLPEPWAQEAGERALQIRYDAQHVAAMRIVEPQADWRGYSIVAVDITNPAERGLELTFRVFDANHDWSHADRLNLPLVIPPQTRTTIRVALAAVESAPQGRSMDLARIADVMLFGREGQPPAELYLSRVWLE
jgi:hypothetical protein